MQNILTFDIEEWYHANYCCTMDDRASQASNFRKNMYRLLLLCKENNCKATYFVLGCIGENHKDIIRDIINEGHEMASHGYSHELAYNHTYDNFLEDVRKSIGILEDITGERVLGYRAPSWSIVERNYHYLEALESLGLKYDASIFPTKNFMYGIPHSKREVHKPIVNGRELNIFEVPTSVIKYIKKGIGYSGGFYFRLFPEFFIKHLMKHANRCHSPSVLYIHPREIDNTEKRLILPPKENFIHYFNIKNTFNKLGRILKHFEFTSIKNYLEQ